MSLDKIILYYGFAPVADPQAVMLWQRTLCESLDLKGRILISPHGINGTLGGKMANLKKYAHVTKEFKGFSKIDFKWSAGSGNEFSKLSVRVRKELVSFATPEEVKVDITGVINGGKHLKPQQVNELVKKRGDDVVFFDARNAFEAEIGRFKNAIVPDIQTTHDFVKELESGKYDHLKDKPIVTYCTGGIRCEILSAVMLNRGFKEVYQIEGGIVRYGEKYRDNSLWEGALFVFDNRMTHNFSDKALTLGTCVNCSNKTSQFRDCEAHGCKDLVLLCDECFRDPKNLKCNASHIRGQRKLQQVG
jgi:UPF0176 protein